MGLALLVFPARHRVGTLHPPLCQAEGFSRSSGSKARSSTFVGPPSGAASRRPGARGFVTQKRTPATPTLVHCAWPPPSPAPARHSVLRSPQAPCYDRGRGDPGAPSPNHSLFAFN